MKVIIYGFGNVGYDYVVQLKKNKYADIIFILDKNAQYKNCLEENNVDILKPEAIYESFSISPNPEMQISGYVKTFGI